ncbi:MAG TPA: NUDIX domain-containing protein [Chloroflexota bacterium]|nr:NUDIX domain-containing protein [Chloroflexota bacterium]
MPAGGYLEELRRAVGQRALIVPGACVAIRDHAGRVLLHRRTDDGSWDLIGGSMEPGETFEQTARREVREEIGVELGDLEPLEVYSGPAFFHTYPTGDEVYHVGVAFQTRDMRGEFRLDPGEVAELEFFALDALPGPLQRGARHHLEEIKRRELR